MTLRVVLNFLGLARRAPRPATCQLPGCSKLCFVETNGRIHDFCSRTHAEQGRRQAGGPSTAAAGFDGTREYVFPDLVLFWQPPSVFSQWTPSAFVIDHIKYCCAEQYMMAEKAKLFVDEDSWRRIMATDEPRVHKKLGREVGGYSQEVWDQHKWDIVMRASYAKFTQNKHMRERLLDTGERRLAEASPLDPVWGIGLRADDPAARTPALWQGQNLLGDVLMAVRAQILAEEIAGAESSSPETKDAAGVDGQS
ncbi:unnamed protein product [Scytosiphon promiscuus]